MEKKYNFVQLQSKVNGVISFDGGYDISQLPAVISSGRALYDATVAQRKAKELEKVNPKFVANKENTLGKFKIAAHCIGEPGTPVARGDKPASEYANITHFANGLVFIDLDKIKDVPVQSVCEDLYAIGAAFAWVTVSGQGVKACFVYKELDGGNYLMSAEDMEDFTRIIRHLTQCILQKSTNNYLLRYYDFMPTHITANVYLNNDPKCYFNENYKVFDIDKSIRYVRKLKENIEYIQQRVQLIRSKYKIEIVECEVNQERLNSAINSAKIAANSTFSTSGYKAAIVLGARLARLGFDVDQIEEQIEQLVTRKTGKHEPWFRQRAIDAYKFGSTRVHDWAIGKREVHSMSAYDVEEIKRLRAEEARDFELLNNVKLNPSKNALIHNPIALMHVDGNLLRSNKIVVGGSSRDDKFYNEYARELLEQMYTTHHEFCTLREPGGSGKTNAIAQMAAMLHREFGDKSLQIQYSEHDRPYIMVTFNTCKNRDDFGEKVLKLLRVAANNPALELSDEDSGVCVWLGTDEILKTVFAKQPDEYKLIKTTIAEEHEKEKMVQTAEGFEYNDPASLARIVWKLKDDELITENDYDRLMDAVEANNKKLKIKGGKSRANIVLATTSKLVCSHMSNEFKRAFDQHLIVIDEVQYSDLMTYDPNFDGYKELDVFGVKLNLKCASANLTEAERTRVEYHNRQELKRIGISYDDEIRKANFVRWLMDRKNHNEYGNCSVLLMSAERGMMYALGEITTNPVFEQQYGKYGALHLGKDAVLFDNGLYFFVVKSTSGKESIVDGVPTSWAQRIVTTCNEDLRDFDFVTIANGTDANGDKLSQVNQVNNKGSNDWVERNTATILRFPHPNVILQYMVRTRVYDEGTIISRLVTDDANQSMARNMGYRNVTGYNICIAVLPNGIIKQETLKLDIISNNMYVFNSKKDFEGIETDAISEPLINAFAKLYNKPVVDHESVAWAVCEKMKGKVLDLKTTKAAIGVEIDEKGIKTTRDGRPKLVKQVLAMMESEQLGDAVKCVVSTVSRAKSYHFS